MGLNLEYIAGQTPLDEDEMEGLLVPTIATRGDLDEFEQKNIEQAIEWVLGHSFKPGRIFTEKFIKDVHTRMFGEVWGWAGSFRKSNKSIGVDKWATGSELKHLNDDALFWLTNETYPPDEIALRFKHRLVSIHCFPNGNGRHSRLMADIIVARVFDLPMFTWGSANIVNGHDARALYLQAIRQADRGNIAGLLQFARS